MEAEGDIRNAKLVESIRNKNGSLPDNSKVIFDRLIKNGADVGFAGAVSGYQANIEESQAKQVAAVMKGQLSEKDAANPDVIFRRAVEGYRSLDSQRMQQAIEDVATLILSGDIDISKQFGYDLSTQGPDNVRRIAMDILAGGAVNTATEPSISSEISIEAISNSPE